MGLDSSDSLSLDLDTGSIISSRNWLEDQLGVNSSDLTFKELEKVRGKVGQSKAIYDHSKRYHKVHDAFQSEYTENSPIISTKNCNGAVYIVRNPLDISISLSHFFNWDLAKCVEFILDTKAILGNQYCGSTQVNIFLGSWDFHIKSWTEQNKIPILLIRYEDLIRDPIKNFIKLSKFLNISNNQDQIINSVKNTSFKNLQTQELKGGGFLEKPGECKLFFRAGKVGEGKKKLNKKQIDSIKSKFEKTLEKLNYIDLF